MHIFFCGMELSILLPHMFFVKIVTLRVEDVFCAQKHGQNSRKHTVNGQNPSPPRMMIPLFDYL